MKQFLQSFRHAGLFLLVGWRCRNWISTIDIAKREIMLGHFWGSFPLLPSKSTVISSSCRMVIQTRALPVITAAREASARELWTPVWHASYAEKATRCRFEYY